MKKSSSKLLKFKSSTSRKKKGRSKDTPQGPIIDEGSLGEMKYRVFKRGVIHIFNSAETLLFKKDCDVFEKELEKLELNSLKDGESKKIEGSGDNDTLIFTCTNNNIVIFLNRPEYGMITKLKNILKHK